MVLSVFWVFDKSYLNFWSTESILQCEGKYLAILLKARIDGWEFVELTLSQRFSTGGTCPLQVTFPILAGGITPSAVMEKINAILRSNSVALQEI